MSNIRFIPKFSIKIPDDVVLFKIFNDKLYVQTRDGLSDAAMYDILESNQEIKQLLEQDKKEKIASIIQSIPGILERDIWTIYDIKNLHADIALEELPIVDTITFTRPFHGNNIVDGIAISESGFGYLGFKNTVIKNNHKKSERTTNTKVDQLGSIIDDTREMSDEQYYDTMNQQINLVYYDFHEKVVKYFSNVLTLTHEINSKYSESMVSMDHLTVSVGSNYFAVRDGQGLFRGKFRDDLYLIDIRTGNCRKITIPYNVEEVKLITKEESLKRPDATITHKIMQDLTLTSSKLDKLTSCLSKVRNDEFKQKINDDDLYNIICEAISEQKSLFNIRQRNKHNELDQLIAVKKESSEQFNNLTFDRLILDDNDNVHLIYNKMGYMSRDEPREITILNVEFKKLVLSESDGRHIIITKDMCQSRTFIMQSDGDLRYHHNKWTVMGSEYYLLTSALFDRTGKLMKYYNNGDVNNIIILNEKGEDVVPCTPIQMYSDNGNIYYDISNGDVTKILCYNECASEY